MKLNLEMYINNENFVTYRKTRLIVKQNKVQQARRKFDHVIINQSVTTNCRIQSVRGCLHLCKCFCEEVRTNHNKISNKDFSSRYSFSYHKIPPFMPTIFIIVYSTKFLRIKSLLQLLAHKTLKKEKEQEKWLLKPDREIWSTLLA